jgi:hypothetical protein
MKRLALSFLAFSIFWISTWMITDIHDLFMLEQPHPIFSIEASAHHENHSLEKVHGENACSYDHGGHLGKTIPIISVKNTVTPSQKIIVSTYTYSWYFRIIPPKFRPPIIA